MPDDSWELISSYSRRQAIEDGTLVDLMQPETASAVHEAGFRYPIAITATAFNLAIWPIGNEDEAKWLESKCQDLQGRLWDVLTMLKLALRGCDGDTAYFRVSVVNWQTKRRNTITLKAVCGPNDDATPCITLMLPDED